MDKYIEKLEQSKITPWLKQYIDIKKDYEDCILLFRIGDFYEMFGEDAIFASNVLGLALTRKNKDLDLPMAGIPHHALNRYLPKLLESGTKIAICEQLEDPKTAGKIVKRGVVRVISPGTIIEEEILNEENLNYILAIEVGTFESAIVAIDLSCSDGFFSVVENANLQAVIEKIAPVEIVSRYKLGKLNIDSIKHYELLDVEDSELSFEEKIIDFAKFKNLDDKVKKAILLLSFYLSKMYPKLRENLKFLRFRSFNNEVFLPQITIKNLEIIDSFYRGGKSLYSSLANMATAMGKRLFKKRLLSPIMDEELLKKRYDAIQFWFDNILMAEEKFAILKQIPDIERLINRLFSTTLAGQNPNWLKAVIEGFLNANNLINMDKEFLFLLRKINESLVEELPNNLDSKDVIKDGVDSQIDEYRNIVLNQEQVLVEIEQKEKEKLGLKNLKIGYNKVFGFYIEISRKADIKLPPEYERKQTLKNVERYITKELKQLEEKILTAREKLKEREKQLYMEMVEQLKKWDNKIKEYIEKIANLDVDISYALLSRERNYTRPLIRKDGSIKILKARHPVVELTTDFIPNDFVMDEKNIFIITGPNMAGKSTYIRQIGIIMLMAQAGLFVPAEKMEFSVVDAVMARIGSADNLSKGQSTFMVEMAETATMLSQATSKSLLIFDEIGRGTSTYDGLSIAASIIEYIHNFLGAKTLFATHYHELVKLTLPRIDFYTAKIYEEKDEVIFTYKIMRGITDKSYGIYVAKLAGLPEKIIERAKQYLQWLESSKKEKIVTVQPILFEEKSKVEKLIIDYLKKLDVDNISARQALEILYNLKEKLTNHN